MRSEHMVATLEAAQMLKDVVRTLLHSTNFSRPVDHVASSKAHAFFPDLLLGLQVHNLADSEEVIILRNDC